MVSSEGISFYILELMNPAFPGIPNGGSYFTVGNNLTAVMCMFRMDRETPTDGNDKRTGSLPATYRKRNGSCKSQTNKNDWELS